MANVTFSSPKLKKDITVYATAGDCHTLLAVAKQHQIPVECECENGECGSCSVQVESRACFSSKRKMRLHTTGTDARRGAQRMAIPFASFATPQTPCCVQTLRDGHALRAWRCYSPLVWMAKLRGSCLALHAMHGRRTFVYC